LGQAGSCCSCKQLLGTGDTVPTGERLGPLHGACRWIDLRLENHRNLLMSDDGCEQIVATPARRSGSPLVPALFRFYAIPLVHEDWLASARPAPYPPPKPR